MVQFVEAYTSSYSSSSKLAFRSTPNRTIKSQSRKSKKGGNLKMLLSSVGATCVGNDNVARRAKRAVSWPRPPPEPARHLSPRVCVCVCVCVCLSFGHNAGAHKGPMGPRGSSSLARTNLKCDALWFFSRKLPSAQNTWPQLFQPIIVHRGCPYSI